MQVSELLNPGAVRVIGEATSKKRLFQRLGEAAHSIYGLDQAQTVDALLDRESLGPTGVGHGVALPHARIAGLETVSGLFFRLEKSMEFESVDRQPVDLVFALLAPEQSGVEHLKALALVSRTMREAAVCAKLRANSDVGTLYTILTEGPASKAA